MDNKVWRIKTEEEFKRDNLWNEQIGTPYGWNSQKKMNNLFGKLVPTEEQHKCASGSSIRLENWGLRGSDYILAYPTATSERTTSTTPSVRNPVIVDDEKNPRFDLDRLSKEINELFQGNLNRSIEAHKNMVTQFKTYTSSTYDDYKQKIDKLFPDIKNALIAEIQRGHTTIVLPDRREIAIQPMDHPKMKDVLISLQTQRKTMLVGPAGTGKTYMVADIAERLKVPFYKYSCSRDSSVHDLIGYKQPVSETYLETVFLKAYEHGGVFLVDEYDAMSGDMALFFNGIADGSKFISIPHRDVQPIAKKHADFFLVMCGNTWGKGSVDYSGRDFQDMALMDRFRFCRHFIGYHTDLERKWMGAKYSFACDLRSNLERLGSYLSTRNIEDIAKLISLDMHKDDVLAMVAQDLNPNDQDVLKRNLENYNF